MCAVNASVSVKTRKHVPIELNGQVTGHKAATGTYCCSGANSSRPEAAD